jgi:hypothetical protein
VLICGCNSNVVVTEELLKLIPLVAAHQTTTGEDISCESEKTLETYKLPLDTLQCLVTDGSPAMIGSKNGAMGKQN